MSTVLLMPVTVFFSLRMMVLKTEADVVFVAACVVLCFLDLFRDKSRVCWALCIVGYSAMSACSLFLCWCNRLFDSHLLMVTVVWLALLVRLFVDEPSCIVS